MPNEGYDLRRGHVLVWGVSFGFARHEVSDYSIDD